MSVVRGHIYRYSTIISSEVGVTLLSSKNHIKFSTSTGVSLNARVRSHGGGVVPWYNSGTDTPILILFGAIYTLSLA